MRSRIFKVVMVAAIAVAATGWTLARPAAAPPPEVGPALVSIGVMTFGPSGVLFAADAQAATIYALELGDQSAGGKAGAADVAAIDQKIAALLGTEAAAVAVKDLVIHPTTKNAYLVGHARHGRRREAGAAPRRRRRQDHRRRARPREVHEGDAAEPAGGRRRAQPARRLDHRHGVRRRQADRRRPVERGVRVEAALGRRIRSRRRTRAPAWRSSTAITAASRRARRCTRSSRTRSTTSRT